jgi:hypothetical protein
MKQRCLDGRDEPGRGTVRRAAAEMNYHSAVTQHASVWLNNSAILIAALCAAFCGCHRHEAVTGDLAVSVDSTLDSSGALHAGENRDAPHAGEFTTVGAKREPDGTLVVDVCVLESLHQSGPQAEFERLRLDSRLWLNETEAGWSARARCCCENVGGSRRWPFETMHGYVRVNGRLRDPSDSPLIIDTTCTGVCAGSDKTWVRRVVLTSADLR